MKTSLNQNLVYLFAAATVAGIRNRLHSKKALRAGEPVLARMLNALESSEAAHARRFLMYLRGKTSDSETFLKEYLASKEKEVAPLYAEMERQYTAAGQENKVENLRQFERVVTAQAELITRYQSEGEEIFSEVYVCGICGFVTSSNPGDNCPICNAVKEKFDRF